MLTDSDLKKIGNLIDEKLESNLEAKLESKLEQKLESKLDEKLETKLEEKLKPITEDIAQIRKDTKSVINFFDRGYLELRKRVEKIEKFLKLN